MFSEPTDQSPQRCRRVGLCRKDVILDHNFDAGERLTIRMGLKSVLFEAQKIETRDGVPAYEVFRVWVPTEKVADEDFGAVCGDDEDKDYDAVLL